MNAKQFLSRAADINKLVEALTEQKAQLSFVGTTNLRIPPQHNGSTSDSTAFIAQKLIDLQEKIDRYQNSAVTVKSEILDAIMKIDNNLHRTVLIHRYINCKDWQEIADTLHYSFNYTRKSLHAAALKNFQSLYDSMAGQSA